MENKQIVLKLILDELGVEGNITSTDDRKTIQKSIYLAQQKALHLGYHFGWYKMGPYSPKLTRDYYSLADALESGDLSYTDKHLLPSIREKLQGLRPLLDLPADSPLSRDQWLELLASYHFLRTVSRQSDSEARRTIQNEKPKLYEFIDPARERLRTVGLEV